MTILTSYEPTIYTGDGAEDTFAIDFAFELTASNIKTSIKNITTGVITTKAQGTHYNVSGTDVVFTAGNIPTSNEKVIIELNMDFLQQTDYKESSDLPAETIENDLDKLTLQDQYLKDLASRALLVDSSFTGFDNIANPGALKYIRFNSDTSGFEAVDLQDITGLTEVKDDLTPQLGGDLDTNGQDILIQDGDKFTFVSGNGTAISFTAAASAVNYINITNAATGNPPIIEAKGDDTNIPLQFIAKGTGAFSLTNGNDTITFPTSDGIAGQVLKTDGAGTLVFADEYSAINLGSGTEVQAVLNQTSSAENTDSSTFVTSSVAVEPTFTSTDNTARLEASANVTISGSAGEQQATIRLVRDPDGTPVELDSIDVGLSATPTGYTSGNAPINVSVVLVGNEAITDTVNAQKYALQYKYTGGDATNGDVSLNSQFIMASETQ